MKQSMLTKSQVKSVEKVIGKTRIKVSMRYDDKCGNGYNTFAITADIYERCGSRWRESMGGCCHEEIVKFFIKHWKLDKNPASSLAKLLLAQEIEQDKDIILLSEELRDSAPKKDLVAYADVLFRVSAVTGGLCDQEINEIICISASLGMDHHYFARNLKQFAEGLH